MSITAGFQPQENFTEELSVYDAHRQELLGGAKGKYVLIKKERIVDTFDTESDAVHRGYQEFPGEPFLVKQIAEYELPLNFSSDLLSL